MLMIGMLSLSTFFNFLETDVNYKEFFLGFLPSIPDSSTFLSIIGSVIMPQNIFLHASLVQTRKHLNFTKETFIKVYRYETAFILVVSFLINASLVGIFAGPEFEGQDVTLENAGSFLRKFLKSINEYVWAIGLIASGISSTATGALTGQYLMNGLFEFNYSRRARILITRAITLIPCFIIWNTINISDAINFLNIV